MYSNQAAYEEICEKAKKYDELKEAVGKIKEEIDEESHYYGMMDRFIKVDKAFDIIDKHLQEVEHDS